jgi:hypothetical protein
VKARAALLSALALTLAACGSSPKPVTLPDIQALSCPATAATETSVPSSLPALQQLARLERFPVPGRIVQPPGHGRAGAEPPITLDRTDTIALGQQLEAAIAVACRLRTQPDAARAGYVLSSTYNEGVGTHWTNWNLVNQPFDPTKPSMLLFAPHDGTVQLVGFSYWVRSSDPDGPAGFTGSADHWHRHLGLCLDGRGMVQRENVQTARECAGTWLNGSDLWMLHAWIVPGAANGWGLFAPLNPALCSRTAPDIVRCPQP